MHTKDYYALLGISKNASSDDIRKAYRTAARKFHPDINKDTGAEERFKEIGEAYEVLKESKKRKLYDQYGHNWQKTESAGAERGSNGFNNGDTAGTHHYRYEQGGFSQSEDLDDILGEIFGQAGAFGGGKKNSGWGQAGTRGKENPVEYELKVSLEDIYHGGVRHISLPTFIRGAPGELQQVSKEVKVTIPKGVADGSVIRLRGAGPDNGTLHIRLKVVPHRRYRVEGYDLKTVVAVSPWEALLGTKIPVETMSGSVKVTVPKGAQNGKNLRIKGKGLARKDGAAGDLIVILELRLPSNLTAEEEKMLQSLADDSSFDPRKEQQQRSPVKVAAEL